MEGVPREKVSVTVDPIKVAQARSLVGSATLSHVIDVALDRLIVSELERRHIAGYLVHPSQPDDDAWAEVERDSTEIADDVDWARLYGVSRPR